MDKRVSKTRDAIIDAYLELIYEKKDQKITISELAHRANIARKCAPESYDENGALLPNGPARFQKTAGN